MTTAAQLVNFPTAAPSVFRPGRVVGIRYTEFSVRPHLEQTLYGPTIERAAHELADMLKRHAGELTPRALQIGSVAILARMPKQAAPELKPGTLQPLAFVDGLTKAELEIGLAKIQRWDWTLVTR